MHREQLGESAEIEKKWRGIGQFHFQGIGVRRTHPDGAEILGLALVEVFRTADVVELVNIFAGRFRQ